MHESKRLETTIRNALAPKLLTAPLECQMVTITEVEISTDGQYATVFISALKEPERAVRYFESQRRELQKALQKLDKKRVPQLKFTIDPRTKAGQTIDDLLAEETKRIDE